MRYLIYVFVLLVLSIQAVAASSVCNIEEDNKADEAIGKVQNWDSLYRIYLEFNKCDNGGTAELFDDAVIKLLANHWATTRHLVTLISRDKNFKKFVLSHISATGDLDQLKRVQINARTHCPKGIKDTCASIDTKATNAIKTLESFLAQ